MIAQLQRWGAAATATLLATLGTSVAQANSKFPEAGQLVVDPADATRIAVRTTFGVLVTSDGGRAWDVICETGVGYANYEPPIAAAAGGRLLLALDEGVARSDAAGCDWQLAGGIAGFVPDLTVSRADPSVVAALTFDAVAQQARYATSTDAAATFTEAAAQPEAGFVPLTLDLATSDPLRVYLSGVRGDPQLGALARSLDGGQSWEVIDIPGTDGGAWPYIAAVDPADADVIYVRLYSDPGRLLRSDDAGDSWSEIFTTAGFLRGFALSPDGSELVVGGDQGVWRAPTDTLAFEQVSSTVALCLTWHAEGLFACGHQFLNDGFAVARSTDGGASFEPLIYFNCIRGVLACDDTSSVGQACPAEWPMLSEQLATATCGQPPTTSSATSASSSSSGAGGGDDQTDGDDGSGCGCALAPTTAPNGLALLAMFAAWRARAARPGAKRRSG